MIDLKTIHANLKEIRDKLRLSTYPQEMVLEVLVENSIKINKL